MKICFVITNDPKNIGGTGAVVSNLMKYTNSSLVYARGPSIVKNILCPFATAVRIVIRKKDIVHAHDHQAFVYALFPKALRKKIVFTMHGMWKTYFKAMNEHGIKAKFLEFLQKIMIKRSDHIIAVSNFVKDNLIKYYNIPSEKITVIHNGVDLNKFKPAGKHDRNTYIWVGTNPKLKMLDEAITYCRKKKKKLLVVGIDGENTSNVKYLGAVANDKMPEIYNKASFLVFFSRVEGHPLVPLEAMACGLGIIANKTSNIEIIPQKKDGSYKISGKKALKIIKKYDWKNVAKKYMEVYKKVMKMK